MLRLSRMDEELPAIQGIEIAVVVPGTVRTVIGI
jgi:hypothetical protein